MKIVTKLLSMSLLLWLGAAYGEPSVGHGRGLRNDARAIQFEQIAAQREKVRAEREARKDERFRERAANDGAASSTEQVAPSHPNEAPRVSKMNADERRALRRQIHEVGHDIYTPPR